MRTFQTRLWTLILFCALCLLSAPTVMAQSDTQPPQLVNMSFSPSSVDVTLSPQTVTFTVHVTDNLSGISFAGVNLRSPSGIQTPFGFGLPGPGVVLDATIDVQVQIPRYGEPGTWTVDSVTVGDRVNNFTFVNTAALSTAGFPTTFAVIDTNPDTVAPAISSILISPNSVDVSSGDATITVDVNFTDALSGFSPTADSRVFFDVTLQSPSGNQSRFISNFQWQFVSGTLNSSLWRASFVMPRYSEPGLWQVTFMHAQDATGNQRFLSSLDAFFPQFSEEGT